jgi:cell division protein ZapA
VKRSVQVDIAGQSLAIRSDEGPEYVRELADFVDARIRELTAGKRTTINMQRVALLAALQIADELLRERDLHARFVEGVKARLSLVEAAMAEHERRLEQI